MVELHAVAIGYSEGKGKKLDGEEQQGKNADEW